jgi:DNA-binding transcriptional regulator YdaS (Cro superfamily)
MKQRKKPRHPGLAAALERVPAPRLAELLCSVDETITPQAVWKWDRVPSARCLDVERVTGVSRYQLRPDIYGEDPRAKGKRQRSAESARVA